MPRFPRKRPRDDFGARTPRADALGPAEASEFNRLIDEIERLGNLTAAPPLTLKDDAAGRQIGADLSDYEPFPALLSGSAGTGSSPYSWSEVTPVAGGSWTPVVSGRAGSSNAYESKGLAGLGHKVVWLKPDDSGGYRFTFNRTGTTTHGTPFCFHVWNACQGPSGALAGVTITITNGSGSIVASGTTDSYGNWCWAGAPASGSFSYSASYPGPAFQPATGAFVIGTTPSPLAFSLLPNTAGGYYCACTCVVPVLLPSVLHLTDRFGTVALALNTAVNGFRYYNGSSSGNDPIAGNSFPFQQACQSPPGGVTVTAKYTLSCGVAGSNQMLLERDICFCCDYEFTHVTGWVKTARLFQAGTVYCDGNAFQPGHYATQLQTASAPNWCSAGTINATFVFDNTTWATGFGECSQVLQPTTLPWSNADLYDSVTVTN